MQVYAAKSGLSDAGDGTQSFLHARQALTTPSAPRVSLLTKLGQHWSFQKADPHKKGYLWLQDQYRGSEDPDCSAGFISYQLCHSVTYSLLRLPGGIFFFFFAKEARSMFKALTQPRAPQPHKRWGWGEGW